MKKTTFFIIASSMVLLLVYYFWNQNSLHTLNNKIESAQEMVDNYQPPAELKDSYDRVGNLTAQYPEFMNGPGFNPEDFSARKDLVPVADDFKDNIDQQRTAFMEDLSHQYKYSFGATSKANRLLEINDEKLVKDIALFSELNAEKVEMYDRAVEYCTTDPENIARFIESYELSSEEATQLSTILKPVDKTLCPKL